MVSRKSGQRCLLLELPDKPNHPLGCAGRAKFYRLPTTVIEDPSTFDDKVSAGFIVGGEMTLDNLDASEGGSVEVSFVAPLVTLKVT